MTTEAKRYLNEAAAARHLNVSQRSLQRWRVSGDGPPFVRVGPRRVLYDAVAIDRWTAAHTYAHRAAEIAA